MLLRRASFCLGLPLSASPFFAEILSPYAGSDFATFIHKDKKAHINNFGVYSIDGTLAVDFLGRFETLEKDLRFALEHVGLSTAEALPDAKTRFRPGSVPYRDHYDEETRNIVTDWYARRSSFSATSSDAERR